MKMYELQIKNQLPVRLRAKHLYGDIDETDRWHCWGPHLFELSDGEKLLYIGVMHSCGQKKKVFNKLYRNAEHFSSNRVLEIFGEDYHSWALDVVKALGLPTHRMIS